MISIKFNDGRSLDKAKEVITKIYSLRFEEYSITDKKDGTISVEFNCPDKAMDAKVFVTTDSGAFHGYLNCYPALNNGKMQTYEEIQEYLEREGIVVNLDEAKIRESFMRFAEGEVVENVPIAEGIPPTPGRDAEVVVHFGNKEKKRPKISADGKIDFKDVENITMVHKGDILITKKPPSPGVRGTNIKGESVAPIPGKDYTILVSDGATVNETGTVYSAMTDGYVEYNGRKLGVYSIYVVKKDVDYSVGNITFNGTVHVCGDVLSGFTIKADKHILVDGLCQDCELIAKGNVILKTGIKCAGKGYVKAGGNAIIGYAEGARIHAKGDIEIRKYSFNSELFAGNNIDAMSGEGIIAGGAVRAFTQISVKKLGTHGNSKFTVIMGMRYFIEFEIERVRKEQKRIKETIEQIDAVLSQFDLTRDKIRSHPKVEKMIDVKRSLEKLLNNLSDREEQYIIENKAKNPKIKVKEQVTEGVTVMFYNVASIIRETMTNVVFYLDEKYKEIAWVSLKDIGAIELENNDE